MSKELICMLDGEVEAIVTIGADGMLNTTTKSDAYYGHYFIEYDGRHILYIEDTKFVLDHYPSVRVLTSHKYKSTDGYNTVTFREIDEDKDSSLIFKRLCNYVRELGLPLHILRYANTVDDVDRIYMRRGHS